MVFALQLRAAVHRTTLVVLGVIAGWFAVMSPLPARAAPPLTSADQAQVEKLLLHRVFPGPTADSGLACKWEQDTCVPVSTHLSFTTATTVPTLDACQTGQATLQACYKAAITRLQDALDAGNALALFEAGYRTKDVIQRAKQGASAPPWLEVEGPTNLLFQFFSGQGLPLAQLGNCRTGTADAKYACLGALPRPIFRAALAALDRHNAILVRNGRIAGAGTRALAIFRSGVAPMTIGMAQRNAFDPTAGAGAAYVHELGKYFFLRAYEGKMTGTAANSEVAHLDTIVGYKPASLGAAPSAYTMIVAANRGGARWNATTKQLDILDAYLRDDAIELINSTHWTRSLLGVRGQTSSLQLADNLVNAVARPMSAENLDLLSASGWWLPYDQIREMQALSQAESYLDPCGWISIKDIYGTERQRVEETRVETYWDQECLANVDQTCDLVAAKGGDYDACYDSLKETCKLERTVTVMVWKNVPVVIGQDVEAKSLREGYWELLESNTTPIYDYDGDGDPDLNYNDESSATIANAGVWAGNATEGCLGELDTLGSQYSSTYNIVGDGADTDGNGAADEDVTNRFGSVINSWDFVPYPVAARICPAYTRKVVGLDDQPLLYRPMTLRAVSATTGTIKTVSINQTCDTPWAYTNRVADLLGDPDLAALRAEIEEDLTGDESLRTTIMDFAGEAFLLALPVAGTFEQHADLAYVAGNVPNGTGDSWYGAHVGVDNLASKLAESETVLNKSLDLVVEFGAIRTGISSATGWQAIPELSEDGFLACSSGACGDNSTTHVRGMFYKRMRDALDLYQRNARTRLEVSWRRLDGKLTSSCLAASDTNADGIADATTCSAATPGCEDICEWSGDADDVVADATETIGAVRDMLLEQEPYLADADLIAYVGDLRAFADAIVVDLEVRRAQMAAGIDYLGDRTGRWAPQITVDAETDLDVLLGTLDASSTSFGYEDFIAGYLERIAVTAQMADTEASAAGTAYLGLAEYCADNDNNIDPDGCGMGSPWTTAETMVAEVNADIRDTLCGSTLRLYYPADGQVQHVERTIDLGAAEYSFYVSQMAGMGYVDGCPQLTSPSFESLGDNTGSVAEHLASLQRALLDIQLQLSNIRTSMERMEDDSYAAAVLGVTLYTFEDQQRTIEQWVDGILCGSAIVGSALACGVTSEFTAGMSCVGAVGGAVSACAALADDDWFDSQVTTEEVQLAFYEYSTSLQENAEMAQLAGELNTFVGTAFDYGDAALAYAGEQAAFSRALAVTNQTMAGMYNDLASDPTAWFFQDQAFQSMKANFLGYADDVRDAHHLLEYATGHAIGEGLTLPIGNTTYCLPRLADITVFKTYDSDFGTARADLSYGSCSAATDPADLNVVAMASVLDELSFAFADVYGARAEQDAWLVGAGSALGGIDRDGDGIATSADDVLARAWNPGEWALLADSGFYDPLGYDDVDSDTNGVVCPLGQIDLQDVCSHFIGGDAVLDATCFDPRTLSNVERVNLAFLDHMVRGEGVETFACTKSASGYTVGVAVADYFTYSQLGGTPAWLANAAPNEDWYLEIPNGITKPYYLAQTRTVQKMIDRYFAEVRTSELTLGAGAVNRVPGTFWFVLDTSSPAGEAGATTPLFDMEQDLLTGDIGATTTMAEQLVSMAFLCSDEFACPDAQPHEVDLVMFGPGYQGDRYQHSSGRQEQVMYRMGPHVMDAAGSWAARITDVIMQAPQIDAMLANPNVQSQFARRPLHTNGMLLSVAGAANSDGDVYVDALTGLETRWALYRTIDPGQTLASRIRIKARYSYYGTSADQLSNYYNLVDLLPCVGAETQLISGTAQTCSLVSPY